MLGRFVEKSQTSVEENGHDLDMMMDISWITDGNIYWPYPI